MHDNPFLESFDALNTADDDEPRAISPGFTVCCHAFSPCCAIRSMSACDITFRLAVSICMLAFGSTFEYPFKCAPLFRRDVVCDVQDAVAARVLPPVGGRSRDPL